MKIETQWGAVKSRFLRAYSDTAYFRVYRRLHPNDPFYAPRAIDEISRLLMPRMRLFEWGSGASTVWFAARVRELTAIEHDPEWFDRTSAQLFANGLSNVDYRLCVADPSLSSAGDASTSALGRPEFANYVSQIDEYPDGYFDVVAIDGRERVGCAQHAVSKVAPGGFIILDDSRRVRYGPIFSLLAGWGVQRFSFVLRETTLFFKPVDGEDRPRAGGGSSIYSGHDKGRHAGCTLVARRRTN